MRKKIRLGKTSKQLRRCRQSVTLSDFERLEERAVFNAAPILYPAASPTIEPVYPSVAPIGAVGTLVAEIVDSTGSNQNFADVDGDPPGIALIGTSLQGGSLYYSTNNGANWQTVGSVSATSAQVFAADSATRLFYRSPSTTSVSIENVISFKAWDQNGGFGNGQTDVNTLGVDGFFPSLRGNVLTSDYAYAVEVSPSGVAFVADGQAGLRAVDVSNPSAPALLGQYNTPGESLGLTLSGDGQLAYVADGPNGFRVISVANPNSLSLVGTLDSADWDYAFDVAAWSNASTSYAYVADGQKGMHVINVKTPSNPTLLGSLDTSGDAVAVAVSANGQNVFVADSQDGLKIIDVSTPSNPRLVNQNVILDEIGIATDVQVHGSTAYLTDDSGVFWLVDVTNRQYPTIVGSVDTIGAAKGVRLSADGTLAYVADNAGYVHVVNIANPLAPVIVGTAAVENFPSGLAVATGGGFVYLAEEDGGLSVVDLDSPPPPTLIGNIRTTNAAATTLAASGNTLYISDANGGLRIVDVSTPGTPSTLATLGAADGLTGNIASVALDENAGIAYVAADDQGLHVVNIADPANPAVITTLPLDGFATDIAISSSDDVVYVTADDAGLHVVSVSNPSNPTLLKTLILGDFAYAVTLSANENTAFVANGINGVRAINVTTPASAAVIDTYNTPGVATDVTISPAGYLFVADDTYDAPAGTSGLRILNASSPSNLQLLGSGETSDFASAVSLSADGNTVFVGVGFGGVDVFDVSTKSAPVLNTTVYTLDFADDLIASVDGEHLFVADGTSGLQVIALSGGSTSVNFSGTQDVASFSSLISIESNGPVGLGRNTDDDLFATYGAGGATDVRPVRFAGQPLSRTFGGFTFAAAGTNTFGNYLEATRDGDQFAVFADTEWNVSGLFTDLTNANKSSIPRSARNIDTRISVVVNAVGYFLNGATNPDLVVERGKSYAFEITAPNHPFYLQTVGGQYNPQRVYSEGVFGNGATQRTLVWQVPLDAPNELFYQSELEPTFGGRIIVTGP